jgi:DNA-binding MarR family transcriptional regulator
MEFDGAPTRLRSAPSWLLGQASIQAARLVTDGFASADSRRYHYSMLAALEEFGPASQASLGRRCGIDRSDVVAVVNELAERGLVERTPDPADRRRNTITITAAGVEHLRRLDSVLSAIQDDLLGSLAEDERETLTRLLGKVLDHHRRGSVS